MNRLVALTICLFYTISSYGLEISVEAGCFKNESKSYLETYIRVLGESVDFKSISGSKLKMAGVSLTIFIYKEGNVMSYEKFILNSPELKTAKDFLDVKRFALEPGRYVLKIEAVDINDENNKIEIEKSVKVMDFIDDVNLSDVQLFGKVVQSDASNPLAKNGIFMEPLSYGLVTEDIKTLNIYTEVYKESDEGGPYFVMYTISQGFSNGTWQGATAEMKKVKKIDAGNSNPILLHLPVDKLPSGNYHVGIAIFDKSKINKVERYVDFVRTNSEFDKEYWRTYNKNEDYSFVSEMNEEELIYALKATAPIVFEPKKSLMNYIIKDAPLRAKKKFLLDFWREREPESTEFHYFQYLGFAKAIDLEYNSNVGYGFETDRGYTFLRYGKPNNVLSIDQEVDAYPYEIWYYNYLSGTGQTNVRFLFYNKSLVHNDYTLLHSTCRVERQNPAWEVELYRKGLEVPQAATIDATSVESSWDRHAKKYFNDF